MGIPSKKRTAPPPQEDASTWTLGPSSVIGVVSTTTKFSKGSSGGLAVPARGLSRVRSQRAATENLLAAWRPPGASGRRPLEAAVLLPARAPQEGGHEESAARQDVGEASGLT